MCGKWQRYADDKVSVAALASKDVFHRDTAWQTLINPGDEIAGPLECRSDIQRMLMLVRDAVLADWLNFAENSCDEFPLERPACCNLRNRGLGRAHKSRRWQVIVERAEFRGM